MTIFYHAKTAGQFWISGIPGAAGDLPLPSRRDLRDYGLPFTWQFAGNQLGLAILSDLGVSDADAIKYHKRFTKMTIDVRSRISPFYLSSIEAQAALNILRSEDQLRAQINDEWLKAVASEGIVPCHASTDQTSR